MWYMVITVGAGERLFSHNSASYLAREVWRYARKRDLEERKFTIKQLQDIIERGKKTRHIRVIKIKQRRWQCDLPKFKNELNAEIVRDMPNKQKKMLAHQLILLKEGKYNKYKNQFA